MKTTFWSSLVLPVAPVVSWAKAACARVMLAKAAASMSVMPRRNFVRCFIAPPRSTPGGPMLVTDPPILPEPD